MQTAAPAPVTRTGGEEQLLLAEVHALCERNELMLIDYNPDAVRVAAAQQPRRDIVSAIRFLAGKRVDIELWHSEKLAYCRRNTPLPEPILFPGVTPETNTPASADTGNNCTGTGSPLPPPAPPGAGDRYLAGRTAIRRCPVC